MELFVQLLGFCILMAGVDKFYPTFSSSFGAFLVGKSSAEEWAASYELDPSSIVGKSAFFVLTLFAPKGKLSVLRCFLALCLILLFSSIIVVIGSSSEIVSAGHFVRNFTFSNFFAVLVLLLSGTVFLWLSLWFFEKIHFVWRTSRFSAVIRISLDFAAAAFLVIFAAICTSYFVPNASGGFNAGISDANNLTTTSQPSFALVGKVVLASTLVASTFGFLSTALHLTLMTTSKIGILAAGFLAKTAGMTTEEKSIVEKAPFAFVAFWAAFLIWTIKTFGLLF